MSQYTYPTELFNTALGVLVFRLAQGSSHQSRHLGYKSYAMTSMSATAHLTCIPMVSSHAPPDRMLPYGVDFDATIRRHVITLFWSFSFLFSLLQQQAAALFTAISQGKGNKNNYDWFYPALLPANCCHWLVILCASD